MTLAFAPKGSSASLPDFEALFSASPNPYVLLDSNLAIVWMNDAYLRATSRERDDLLGRGIFEAFPSPPESDSYKLLQKSLNRVLSTGKRDEIALIRYDIAMPGGRMDERYWSATHTPFHQEGGAASHILQHTVDVTELHNLRRLRDEMGVVERANAIQARNRDLAEESDRLKTLFEQAPGFVAILTGSEHRFVIANEAYRTLVGKRDLIGKSVAEALPEIVEQGFIDLLDEVRASGKPYVGRRALVYLHSGKMEVTGEPYYLDFIYQPIVSSDGVVSGVFVQGQDVTEQVRAEDRQKLLINELNHRVKNTLSIVQGLAMQTFRRVPESAAAQAVFDSRLIALAAAHTLLTEHEWDQAELSDVLRRSVDATAGVDADRVDIRGPTLMLQPQTAVSLAMMTHELSTNAIKYGALSVSEGRVTVSWTVADTPEHRLLSLTWVESDGPPVEAPSRRGFGTRLIERGMSSELRGDVRMEFQPDGLRCTVTARVPRTDT